MAALVSTPPVPIDALHCSSQFPTVVNPFGYFKDGAALYQVLQYTYVTSGDFFVAVYKSTNDGLSWSEMDSANHIDLPVNVAGMSACFDAAARKIYILWRDVSGIDFVYKVTAFDTPTDLYGTPSGASARINGSTLQAAIYRQSGGTLVVVNNVKVGAAPGLLNYLTLIAGVWAGPTPLGSVNEPYVLGVDVDASDRGHLIWTDNSTGDLNYALISAGLTLGSTTLLSAGGVYDFLFIDHRIWNNKIVYCWGEGVNATVFKVAIGTPLAAPVFTTYTVTTVGAAEFLFSPTLAEDNAGKLVAFNSTLNNSGTITDLNMWTFDGMSSFGSPTLFYDQIANPPQNNTTNPGSLGCVTGTALQYPSGDWVYSTAMTTKGPLNNTGLNAGFTLLTRACPGGGGSGNLYFAH